MPKFIVKASYVTYLSAEIEAETMEEAENIAHNLDGGDFEQDGGDDWSIDEVYEVAA